MVTETLELDGDAKEVQLMQTRDIFRSRSANTAVSRCVSVLPMNP